MASLHGVSEGELKVWQSHVQHAAGFSQNEFTTEELCVWRKCSAQFDRQLQEVFFMHSQSFPKKHDITHAAEIVTEVCCLKDIICTYCLHFSLEHTPTSTR